jgi:hypothetical protein
VLDYTHIFIYVSYIPSSVSYFEKPYYTVQKLCKQIPKFNVAGFGVAIISEFLSMIFPNKFYLWNDKPRTILQFLRLNVFQDNLYKYNTATGEQLAVCRLSPYFLLRLVAFCSIKLFVGINILIFTFLSFAACFANCNAPVSSKVRKAL